LSPPSIAHIFEEAGDLTHRHRLTVSQGHQPALFRVQLVERLSERNPGLPGPHRPLAGLDGIRKLAGDQLQDVVSDTNMPPAARQLIGNQPEDALRQCLRGTRRDLDGFVHGHPIPVEQTVQPYRLFPERSRRRRRTPLAVGGDRPIEQQPPHHCGQVGPQRAAPVEPGERLVSRFQELQLHALAEVLGVGRQEPSAPDDCPDDFPEQNEIGR
jgi:hypothetical protein